MASTPAAITKSSAPGPATNEETATTAMREKGSWSLFGCFGCRSFPKESPNHDAVPKRTVEQQQPAVKRPSNGATLAEPNQDAAMFSQEPLAGPAAVSETKPSIYLDSQTTGYRTLYILNTFPKSLRTHKWRMQDFQIFQLLHNGYAALVYQALCPLMNEMVALKVYSINKLDAMTKYQLTRELNIHTKLQHRHIISVYAVFQDNNYIVLVQEFAAAGDLKTIVRRHNGRLAERLVVEKVLEPLLQALHFLHSRNILHRDIKHKNILFTEDGVLKLADFGIAIDLTEEKAVSNVGTHGFMAPEVLKCPSKQNPQDNKSKEHLHYNFSADCWSVGVLVYQLLIGSSPFDNEDKAHNMKQHMTLKLEFTEDISEAAEDFVRQLLQSNPEDRPTTTHMLHHPWVSRHKARVSLDKLKVSKESLAAEYAAIKRTDSMDDCAGLASGGKIFAHSAKALGRSTADFEPVTIHAAAKDDWNAMFMGFMSGELRPKRREPIGMVSFDRGNFNRQPLRLLTGREQEQKNNNAPSGSYVPNVGLTPHSLASGSPVSFKPQALLMQSPSRDASMGIRLQPRPAAVPLPMRTQVSHSSAQHGSR